MTIYHCASTDEQKPKIYRLTPFLYSPFHRTLPKSSLQIHWISARFYEMVDLQKKCKYKEITLLNDSSYNDMSCYFFMFAHKQLRAGFQTLELAVLISFTIYNLF